MYTLEQEPTVGLSRGFVFEYCPSPSSRSSPAFLKDNEVFHAPCFGDDDFDLESLTTCKSSTKFSAQTTQHSIQPAAYTMSQAQGNMDLSQPSANQSGMSILETLERLAPKFPPQDFDVPDISVTNSDLFSSSINIRLHSPTVPNASIQSNISSSVGGTNQGVSTGFQNHTGVSSPTSTGSNMTVSPLRESSEDSDDCLPLAQLAIKRQAQDDPVPESKSVKKPRTPKKRKKKDPNEPQKPVSAYALFFRDTQAAIKGQNSTASFGEVSKIVASMWEGLDPEHKNVYKKKTEVAKKEYLKQLAAYRASLVSQTTFDEQGHNEVTSSPPRLSPHRMTAANLSSPDVQLGMMTDMSPPHPQVYGMESPRHQGVMGALSPSHPALQNGSSPPHMKYGNGSPQYTIMDSPSHVMSQPLQQQGMVTYHHQSPQHSLSYSSPLHGDLSPVSAEVVSLSHYPVIAPRPSSHMRHQQPQSMPSSGGILAPGMCIRNGCTNRAIDNVGWDSEYCSNECVVSHCRDVFTAWVAARQVTGNSYIIK